MDEWTNTWIDGRTHGRVDIFMERWTDKWVDGRTHGWMDGRTHGCMDGWMDQDNLP